MGKSKDTVIDKRGNFTQIDNEVMLDYDLNPYEFRVYAQIACYAGSEKKAWPGQKKLATVCKMSVPTVIKSIKALEEKHLLAVEHSGEQGTVNHYILLPVPKEGIKEVKGGSKPALGGGINDVYSNNIQSNKIQEQDTMSSPNGDDVTPQKDEKPPSPVSSTIEGDKPTLSPQKIESNRRADIAIVWLEYQEETTTGMDIGRAMAQWVKEYCDQETAHRKNHPDHPLLTAEELKQALAWHHREDKNGDKVIKLGKAQSIGGCIAKYRQSQKSSGEGDNVIERLL